MTTELVVAVVVCQWVAGAIAVGWAASVRGRSVGAWIAVGIFLSPVFAVLLLIAAGPMTEAERSRIAAENAEIAAQERGIAARRAAEAEHAAKK